MVSAQDFLMPNGNLIGIAGSKPIIREVRGDETDAEDLFNNLSVGGSSYSFPGYPGKMIQLPGGGFVGFRPKSKSGPPTIDIDIPGIPIKKVKFV